MNIRQQLTSRMSGCGRCVSGSDFAAWCRFAVIPLSEDCGFIEWVPQTVTLRKVCEETYTAEGIFDKTSLATCKKILDNFTVSLLNGLITAIIAGIKVHGLSFALNVLSLTAQIKH